MLFHHITAPPTLKNGDIPMITKEGWQALHRMIWDWMAWAPYYIRFGGPGSTMKKFCIPAKASWPGWVNLDSDFNINNCFACSYAFLEYLDSPLHRQGVTIDSFFEVQTDDPVHYCDYCPINWGEQLDSLRFACENADGSPYRDFWLADSEDFPNPKALVKDLRVHCCKVRDKKWIATPDIKEPPHDSPVEEL